MSQAHGEIDMRGEEITDEPAMMNKYKEMYVEEKMKNDELINKIFEVESKTGLKLIEIEDDLPMRESPVHDDQEVLVPEDTESEREQVKVPELEDLEAIPVELRLRFMVKKIPHANMHKYIFQKFVGYNSVSTHQLRDIFKERFNFSEREATILARFLIGVPGENMTCKQSLIKRKLFDIIPKYGIFNEFAQDHLL